MWFIPLDEVHQAIREHELSKSTKYITVKKDKMFGKEDFDLLHSEVRFEDTQKSTVPYIPYDGVPFIIVGRKRMACHHGKDTHLKEKERKKVKDHPVGDHDYKKKRKLLQPTKKKDCSAGIRVRHIIRFPDYQVSDCGKRSEKDADASLIQPIDEDLKKYIGLMVVQHQVGSTFQMKLLLEVYVKQTLFNGHNIPSRLNKRFWPSIKDIKNHMALALLRLHNTNVDQAVVSELVTKWEIENPKDNFFIRVKKDNDDEINQDIPLCPENDDDDDDNGEDLMLDDETLKSVSVTDEKFLFIHQSDFQKQLLLKYGQEMCLMDATYRTTQYAVPLYFICVPTTVNYMTVATFITETEDSNSIKKVLLQLRQ
ncbi:unnamed protein product [Mytilus coruscus]|uniref:MULE transposase domain-containing protein n=1 Tax=Mytilus coruscus TaxID=42192 RepID=A0A6J8D9G2_MYTCO|nr:unnamed protein product [Mytilus coruscus]